MKKTVAPLSGVVLILALALGWLLSDQKTQRPRAPARSPQGASDGQGVISRDSPITSASTVEKGRSSGSESITIGTWNIEWLGKPTERSGAGKGVAQDPEELADVIRRSGASILALEEISPTAEISLPRSKELDRVAASLNKEGQWKYLLFPSRSGDQFTGVLWNASRIGLVETNGEDAWRVPVPTRRSTQGSGLWVRPPEAVKFTVGAGRTDFVLVIVHMKADYNGDFSRQREEEADALAGLLPDIRKVFSDDDIVILGDTNMTRTDEPAERVLTKAGFRDLNGGETATHWRGGATDKIFVPISQPEFQNSTFSVRDHDAAAKRSMSPAEYKRRYSDHYPVFTTIKVMGDDD